MESSQLRNMILPRSFSSFNGAEFHLGAILVSTKCVLGIKMSTMTCKSTHNTMYDASRTIWVEWRDVKWIDVKLEGPVTSFGAAILDLWCHHFQPQSWICGDDFSRHLGSVYVCAQI